MLVNFVCVGKEILPEDKKVFEPSKLIRKNYYASQVLLPITIFHIYIYLDCLSICWYLRVSH